MLTAALAPDLNTPSIVMALVPGTTGAGTGVAPGVSAPANLAASAPQLNTTLLSALSLDASNLNLSDTGGSVTGSPDTSPLTASLVSGTDYYFRGSATIDTIGADVYVMWDSSASQWTMTINTDGGLTWTGLGSSSYDSPTGTYATASWSDAGSGYVLAFS